MTVAARPMSLKMDASIRERLARLAHARKRTSHAIAREAVENYVAREEARDQFTADALEAWVEFQETGLHATGDEVLAWMKSWGTSNELPQPVCHV
jgi:predicted transcriptional regulator